MRWRCQVTRVVYLRGEIVVEASDEDEAYDAAEKQLESLPDAELKRDEDAYDDDRVDSVEEED